MVADVPVSLIFAMKKYYLDRTKSNLAVALLTFFPFPWTFAFIAQVNHTLLDSAVRPDSEVFDLIGKWEMFNLPRVVALGVAAVMLEFGL